MSSARTDVLCERCGTRTDLRGGGWGRGFSLLELAITLVVVAILSIPAMFAIDAVVDEFRSYEPVVPAEFLDPDGTLPAGVCGP